MKTRKERRINFTNKTIVITGASSGAGRAMAVELAKYGAKLVLVARRVDALKEVVQQCNELGGLALAMPADVRDADALKDIAAKANEFGGRIDVWINNAGVLAAGDFTETPTEIHEQVIHTNLLGYLYGAHAVLPYFKQQKHGTLINNVSVGGWMPVPYGVAYSASKFGLTGFSEALRGELTKYRYIRICDLFPAFLDTPGIQHAANYTGKILKPAPPVYDPQEVARAVVSVVNRPRRSVTIGSVSTLLKIANAVAPTLTRTITAKLVEGYLKVAEPTEHTSGNIMKPVDYGTGIHGGWSVRLSPSPRSAIGAAFLASVAAAFFITRSQVSK
ncbi:SDR family oxidoreductase [Aridibaculum aurantiacum]|uniref:SDR family oxidoreductase n=1 Tax=Aridibaculum aurantiacum TaxID=2810307 RepID=UPI001A967D22|nr:SDR family oxidoreductase [Aridibaculum aurantiacum]